MSDDLSRILRGLPAATAAPGFAENVMRRLPGRPRRRHSWMVSLVAVILAVGMGVAAWLRFKPSEVSMPPREERLLALWQEHQRLAGELQRLRASRETERLLPVVYLGGEEQVDYVIREIGEIGEVER